MRFICCSGLLLIAMLGHGAAATAQDVSVGSPGTSVDSEGDPGQQDTTKSDTVDTSSVEVDTARPELSPSHQNTQPATSNPSSKSAAAPAKRNLNYGVILKRLKGEVPGDVVNVKLKQEQRGVWIYEFTVLDRKGRSTLVTVSARTATILSKKRR